MPETPGSSNPFRRKAAAPSSSSTSASAPSAATTAGGSSGSPSVFPDAPDDPPPATTLPSSSDFFRSHLQTLPQSAQPPPSTSFQKPKVVKRVRVQSPPPSSPESVSFATETYPAGDDGEDNTSSGGGTSSDEEEVPGVDPFRGTPSPITGSEGEDSAAPTPPPASQQASHRPPPNPFQKTLEDVEQSMKLGGQLENAPAGAGKGSLDVQAFRELLLAGLGGGGAAAATAGAAATNAASLPSGDGASITDASSISKQSVFDAARPPESPRTSHEISEPGEDDQLGLVSGAPAKSPGSPSTLRKKPRPPNSRHGKLIKGDVNSKNRSEGKPGASSPGRTSPTGGSSSPSASPSKQRPATPSDVNKPLPPAPAMSSIDGEGESIFDKEAAGKVPEPDADVDVDAAMLPPPRPPTPPNASHVKSLPVASPQGSRKPAPPPRRNPHARGESKASVAPKAAAAAATAIAAPSVAEEPELARRGSIDSTRSRSSSLRVSIHAPAPPPPRRPNHHHHASRQSASFASPSALSFSSIASSSSATSPTVPETDGSSSSHLRHGSIADTIISTDSNITASPPAMTATTPATAAAGTTAASLPTQNHHVPPVRLSPPAPPPARNTSVRSPGGRPASVSSLDAATPRRASREKEGSGSSGHAPPPPPPPRPKRSRGGSKGAADGGPRRTASGDSARALGGAVAEEPEVETVAEEAVATGAGNDILADLDALQREVDAMRGQMEKAGSNAGEAGSSG